MKSVRARLSAVLWACRAPISTVIGAINTSFLAQGNAFVAGLPNPTPDQTSGGIWGRVIGGRVDEKATGTFNGSIGPSAAFGNPPGTGTVTCNSAVRLDYGGFQMGQDIAKLNIGGNGGTIHVGVTGGYAEANAQDRGGSNFTGNFQVPFAGAYAAYTRGKFFAECPCSRRLLSNEPVLAGCCAVEPAAERSRGDHSWFGWISL